MESNIRKARLRALAWQTLDALTVLIGQVRNPVARSRLEAQRIRLEQRLRDNDH